MAAETETQAVAIETAEEDTALAILALTRDAAVEIVIANATLPDLALTLATTSADTLAQPLVTTSAEVADLLLTTEEAPPQRSKTAALLTIKNEPRQHKRVDVLHGDDECLGVK